jgi:hypothetical protein
MRIRSIHPEFWRSEDVAALDWQTRLLFIGLWSYVDDNGAGRDVEKLICAELFPLEDDPRETLATVARGLQALSDGGQIDRYTVDGKPFLFICAWAKWQRVDRPGKERYPLPTCKNAEPREPIATASRKSRDTPSTGEGEKGRRGEGEKAPGEPAAPPEASHLCNVLADLIEANGSKRPKVTKAWLDSARLMLVRDSRDAEAAEELIRWSQENEFWRTNILSMPTFREKYDRLRLQRDNVVALRKLDDDEPAYRRNNVTGMGRPR